MYSLDGTIDPCKDKTAMNEIDTNGLRRQEYLKESWGWTESPENMNSGMPIAGMLNSNLQLM